MVCNNWGRVTKEPRKPKSKQRSYISKVLLWGFMVL